MSTVKYRHEFNKAFVNDGIKNLIKEKLIDGSKGLSFELTTKEGNAFHRISVKQIEENKYIIKEKIDEKIIPEKEIILTDLKKIIKENKNLGFVQEFLKNNKPSLKGGAKKQSKKISKKISKKQSKKISKKTIKKNI
jgi:hypothetical protein